MFQPDPYSALLLAKWDAQRRDDQYRHGSQRRRGSSLLSKVRSALAPAAHVDAVGPMAPILRDYPYPAS